MSTKPPLSNDHEWEQLKDLVADALDEPAETRLDYIDQHAKTPTLAAEAKKLIGNPSAVDGGMLHPRVDRFVGLDGPDTSSLQGKTFGKYELVRLLGEGGMAAVYLARQAGVERPVALKVLRPSALGYDAARRFAREVAAQGRLEHPGIARIYDAGVWRDPALPTAAGVPFIAMEFIDGEPLNRFAASQALSPRRRIALVADIADAVHAAHQRAIVHRDLKPANILVAPGGDHGRPKILDFGIARVLQHADGDASLSATFASRARNAQTTAGMLLGTLAYMAPEQARGQSDLVDVRCDVYALGVMLHELLLGQLPVDVSNQSLTGALQLLGDPNITPARIENFPGGDDDLRTILATALATEPSRRYASAEALGDDLRRWLGDEPIDARPPTRIYLARKFVRRNRAVVIAASLVMTTLLAGVIASSIGFVRERNARSEAQDNFEAAEQATAQAQRNLEDAEASRKIAEIARLEAEEALRVAERDRARSDAARGFVTNMIDAGATESNGGTRDVTLVDALALMEPDLGDYVRGDHLLEADLRQVLAEAYMAFSRFEDCDRQILLAVEALDRVEDENVAAPKSTLLFARGQVLATGGYTDEAAAALAIAEQAWPELREAIANEALLRTANRERLEARAAVMDAMGDPVGAAKAYDELLAAFPAYVPGKTAQYTDELTQEDHISTRMNAAIAYMFADRLDEAVTVLRGVVAEQTELFGEDHLRTIRGKNNLAGALMNSGELDEAEAISRKALDDAAPLGDQHELVRRLRNTLSNTLALRRDPAVYDEMIALMQQNVDADRDAAASNFDLLVSLNNLGQMLITINQFEEGAKAIEEAIELLKQEAGEEHPAMQTLRSNLAGAEEQAGDLKAAETQLRQVLAAQEAQLGPTAEGTVITRNNLGNVLRKQGRSAEASVVLRDAVDQAVESGFNFLVPLARRNLGRALSANGQHDEAVAELIKAHAEAATLSAAAQAETAAMVADALDAAGRSEEAADWRDRASAAPAQD